MKLTVRLFAAFREKAGVSRLDVDVREGAAVSDVVAAVLAVAPELKAVIGTARPVVNEEFADGAVVVRAGDDVALLPPLSGGSKRFWLTDVALVSREVESLVEAPGCGAIVTFVGTVRKTNEGRDVDYLEYEAYPGMAEKKMEQIGDEIATKWGLERVAMVHRIGRCDVGEASIVISVASPHRAAAFDACRYAIDRVKEIVPVWKKEVWKDGSVWIGMHA